MLARTDDQTRLQSQRVDASARIAVRRADGRTRLETLYQHGAAKIRLPRTGGDPLEAILINTAGGLTGGDRLAWEVDVGAQASACLTTQACEKLYRNVGAPAATRVSLRIGAGGRLAWLPQETIAYRGSALHRTIDADLEPDGELLLVEAAIFGRAAMGETAENALLRDRWRIRCSGRLVHAEDLRLGPDLASQLPNRAVAGGAAAMATVLLVAAEPERHLDRARAVIGEAGGASVWAAAGFGKLLARLVAADGYALRERLVPLVELLNGRAGLPKAWSL